MPIRGSLYSSDVGDNSRNDDATDIALFKLSASCKKALNSHFHPFQQARTELLTSSLDAGCCSISGYPISRSSSKAGQMSSEVYSFRGVAAKYETYERIGLDPSANIAIHFVSRFKSCLSRHT